MILSAWAVISRGEEIFRGKFRKFWDSCAIHLIQWQSEVYDLRMYHTFRRAQTDDTNAKEQLVSISRQNPQKFMNIYETSDWLKSDDQSYFAR